MAIFNHTVLFSYYGLIVNTIIASCGILQTVFKNAKKNLLDLLAEFWVKIIK